ncbi:MAG: oxidoreductase, partial [Ramlibacter sp.]
MAVGQAMLPVNEAAQRIAMRLVAIRYQAAGIQSYEFRALDGQALPSFTAGAHVDLHLPGGLVRQYSLCNPQDERHRYVVAVKRDANGRGGSAWLHDHAR